MITYEEYQPLVQLGSARWATCGALATRMGLRLFPFFVGKVTDAKDNGKKSRAYFELVSSTLCVLAAARTAAKYPKHILRRQIADAGEVVREPESAVFSVKTPRRAKLRAKLPPMRQ